MGRAAVRRKVVGGGGAWDDEAAFLFEFLMPPMTVSRALMPALVEDEEGEEDDEVDATGPDAGEGEGWVE